MPNIIVAHVLGYCVPREKCYAEARLPPKDYPPGVFVILPESYLSPACSRPDWILRLPFFLLTNFNPAAPTTTSVATAAQ